MVLKTNYSQLLILMGVVHQEHMNKKVYFKDYPKETEGLISPEELKKLYNMILEQALEQGEVPCCLKKID
ncbi:MAG: hypothetical protein ACERKV_03920 [Clostridiaceae bacterium]